MMPRWYSRMIRITTFSALAMIFALFGGVIRSSVAKLKPESVLWRKPTRLSVSKRSIVFRRPRIS